MESEDQILLKERNMQILHSLYNKIPIEICEIIHTINFHRHEDTCPDLFKHFCCFPEDNIG